MGGPSELANPEPQHRTKGGEFASEGGRGRYPSHGPVGALRLLLQHTRRLGPVGYTRCINVLVVCTGNVCRSPMAAALLVRRLRAAGMSDPVSSAGLLQEGAPASPGAVKAMASRSIDLGGHRASVLSPEMLVDAELVIGMAREHVREAVVLLPSAWPRTFTLKELVRRGSETGRRGAHERIADWLERLGEGREPGELMGVSSTDDIADPIGMNDAAYEATACELDDLVAKLVELVWGARVRVRVAAPLVGGHGGLAYGA